MRVTPVDLIGGFGRDNALQWHAQDVCNWIPEVAEGAAKSQLKLRFAPGLDPFADVSDNPVRCMHVAQDRLFVVAGTQLWEVTGFESASPIGTIPGTGRVEAAHNLLPTGHEVAFANGSALYVYDTRTRSFSRVTDDGYPGSWSIDYIDGYLIGADPFGRFAFHSEVAQAGQYNTLDRFDSEVSPDKIVRPVVSQSEVVIFSERSTEFFVNTGATTGTFQSRRTSIERGIGKARYSAVKLDNSIFWLGDDGIFYRLNNYGAQPVAMASVQKAIAPYDWARCIGMTFEDQGHKVAYWTFPGGQTFGYDVTTGLWHRRASPGLTYWRASHLVKWRGRWYAGDLQRGRIYRLDWAVATDNGEFIECELTPPHLHDNLNPITPLRVELLLQTGTSDNVGVSVARALVVHGNLPNGGEGDVVSYTYTATGGFGPYTYAVSSGALPTGLGLSSAGVLSGTVDAGGTFTWTVTATDSEGRTASVVDSASFTDAVETYAVGETVASTYGLQISPSGASFASPAIVPSPNFQLFEFGVTPTGRIIAVTGVATVRHSDDNGASWTIVTVPGISIASGRGFFIGGGAVLIPGGQAGYGVLRSTDNGATYSVIEAARNYNVVAGKSGLVVALSATNAPSSSSDNGATWSAEGARLDTTADAFSLGSGGNGATDGTKIVFPGQAWYSSASMFGAAVAITTNGTAFTFARLQSTPTGPGSQGVTIAYGSGVWVVGCEDGRVFRSVDDMATWSEVANFGARVEKIVYNGVYFFAGGRASGAGYMRRSRTGELGTWAVVSHPFGYKVESFAVKPAA